MLYLRKETTHNFRETFREISGIFENVEVSEKLFAENFNNFQKCNHSSTVPFTRNVSIRSVVL